MTAAFIARLVYRAEGLKFSSDPLPESHLGCFVLFRGHLANADEIRDGLKGRGLDLRSNQPHELLAAAYRRWGANLSDHLDGCFSFVIVDSNAGTALIGHDDLGQSPLFYTGTANEITVSSHLERILEQSQLPNLDEEYIADYIAQCWHLGERTPFQGVKRIGPGTGLLICLGREIRHVRSDMSLYVRPGTVTNPAETLSELITAAVRTSLPKRGRVACELSGGLDSSTVLLTARSLDADVGAFSYIYTRSSSADERAWIGAVLDKAKSPWHTVDSDECLPFSGQFSDFHAEPSLALLAAARHKAYDALLHEAQIDYILTGIGGDSVLFGDTPLPFFLADHLRKLKLGALVRDLSRWRNDSADQRSLVHWFLRAALVPLIRTARGYNLRWEPAAVPWLSHAYAAEIGVDKRGRDSEARRCRSVSATGQFQGIGRAAYAVSMRYQRQGARAQFRHPLLSRSLIRFMANLPPHLQYSPESDRLLHRHAIAGLVPDLVRMRRGKGGPDEVFLRGLARSSDWRIKLGDQPHIVERGYVDPHRWRDAIARAAAGYVESMQSFQATASLEAWLQQLALFRPHRPATLKQITG